MARKTAATKRTGKKTAELPQAPAALWRWSIPGIASGVAPSEAEARAAITAAQNRAGYMAPGVVTEIKD